MNRSEAVLTESRRHRQKRSARTPPTPRNKQTFLKILAFCREKHRLWRKQRATVRTLDHEESRHDRAGKKRRAVAESIRHRRSTKAPELHACMHACRRAVVFSARLLKPVQTCLAQFYCHRNWKWQLALASLTSWESHWACIHMNEPRRGERWSLRNDNCGLAGRRSGPCGPRRKKSRLFSKTLSSPAVLFPDVLFSGFCGFRFAEERRTFADMWTSLDTFSWKAACAQKCLRQPFWAFFYTSLWRARTVGPVFPALLFPVAFLDFLCTNR